MPYRGQPSVVYRVPFTVGSTIIEAVDRDYYGYGYPDGADGDDPAARLDDHDRRRPAPVRRASSSSPKAATCIACKVTSIRIGASDAAARPSAFAATEGPTGDVELSFVAPGVGRSQARSAATRSGCARPTR